MESCAMRDLWTGTLSWRRKFLLTAFVALGFDPDCLFAQLFRINLTVDCSFRYHVRSQSTEFLDNPSKLLPLSSQRTLEYGISLEEVNLRYMNLDSCLDSASQWWSQISSPVPDEKEIGLCLYWGTVAAVYLAQLVRSTDVLKDLGALILVKPLTYEDYHEWSLTTTSIIFT